MYLDATVDERLFNSRKIFLVLKSRLGGARLGLLGEDPPPVRSIVVSQLLPVSFATRCFAAEGEGLWRFAAGAFFCRGGGASAMV
jgi:hypothetical protein